MKVDECNLLESLERDLSNYLVWTTRLIYDHECSWDFFLSNSSIVVVHESEKFYTLFLSVLYLECLCVRSFNFYIFLIADGDRFVRRQYEWKWTSYNAPTKYNTKVDSHYIFAGKVITISVSTLDKLCSWGRVTLPKCMLTVGLTNGWGKVPRLDR